MTTVSKAPKCFMCGEAYPKREGMDHTVTFKKYVIHDDGKSLSTWERTESICLACYGLYQDRTSE